MQESKLELVTQNSEVAIVKHLCFSTYDVALNPEFALNHDYYAITRGKDHVFTIVYKDGSTSSFDFGDSGSTLISYSTTRLKNRVLDFLKSKNVLIDLKGYPTDVKIWKNYNGKTAIRFEIEGKQEYEFWDFDGDLEAAKKRVRSFVDPGVKLDWEEIDCKNGAVDKIWKARL